MGLPLKPTCSISGMSGVFLVLYGEYPGFLSQPRGRVLAEQRELFSGTFSEPPWAILWAQADPSGVRCAEVS